jgi:uncharacterized membrane protein
VIAFLRTVRWRPVVLVLSLAVNLFFAGLFVTRHVFGPPRGPDAALARLIGELGGQLSAPDRATLQRVFATHEAEIKERGEQAMQSRAAIRAAMVAEPFDSTALTAAVAEAGARDMAMRRAIERMLVEAATLVSPEGRSRLAASRPLRH